MKIEIDDIITTDGYLEFCKNNNISYIKTDYFHIGHFNWRGENHPSSINEIIVTGHSDYPITDEIAIKFKKVFCINRNTNEENVYGIPLGLTNDCDDSTLHRLYGNKELIVEVMNKSIDKSNLIYMNFNTSTHPERILVWDYFSKLKWVKIGNIENSISGRKKFLEEIKSSKFTLCPRGNGIDTHRIWESLYMGSIPIVKYENAHHLFKDLPILFIDNWDEITEEFLEKKYIEYTNKKWNFNKLKISYWTNFIKNEIKNEI